MKHKKHYLPLLIFLFSAIGYSQISVDDTYTTQELVENFLFNSSCVDLSNFSQSTGTDFGESSGVGSFNANGSDFPFQEGIILSSGYVYNAPGPNTGLIGDGFDAWPGDADLNEITGAETHNASNIQFDFVPQIDQISFNFIFVSEEYNQNYECSFSDAFAFILTHQETGVSQNLAVLPGTNIPIQATNIHPEVPGQCDAINEEYFDKYNFQPYNDENLAPINFNGQIKILSAQGQVIPGDLYTIKLVVADASDTVLDSAVFIESGSFDIGNVNLGADITPENNNTFCEGEVIILNAGDSETATYTWYKDDIVLVGETGNTLEVTTDGIYKVEVAFTEDTDCVATDEIVVIFYKNPIFDLGEDISICDGGETILDAGPSNLDEINSISYAWFKNDNEISGETNSTLIVTESGTYTVELTTDCGIATDSIMVQIIDFSVSLGDELILCDEDSITLNPVITGDTGTNISYLWSTGETTETIEITETGTYTVEVTINGCLQSASVSVILESTPEIILADDFKICLGENVQLTATTPEDGITYQWIFNGNEVGNSNTLTIDNITENEIGTYEVIISKGVCEWTDEVDISSYDVGNCIITQGISPGGTPGYNDNLDLEFLNDRTGISKLQIFNRYGTIVYEKQNYINEWFGQDNNGNELPTGTYYYVIDLLDKDDVYGSQPTGWIYLNRGDN